MDDDGSANIAKGQRARLTCTECHRRKIKCDKNIPCGTCCKRGLRHLCARDSELIAGRPASSGGAASDTVVQTLLNRVAQLESRLKGSDNVSELGPVKPQSSPMPPAAAEVFTERAENIDIVNVNEDDGDAAVVLEFLAWGRKKDADFADAPEHDSGPRRHGVAGDAEMSHLSNMLTENIRNAQLDMLEALLPKKAHILQLIDYHDRSVLWYHCSYSSIIFQEDLQTFFTEYGGDIRHRDLNLQWLALLYSILTAALTCSSQSICRNWGFSETERISLSAKWYEASTMCLNMANYIENQTIYSIQAISTLTIAAHTLGFSNSQSVLLASAGRLAQSLGLHRLGSEKNPATMEHLRKREAGRRVFTQLCTQDWFQVPFSESYALNPRYANSIKPLNCNDDDMIVQPQAVPTQASYCNYRYEIAMLMPQLLDAMSSCNTLFTKYEQVLQFDDKMRKLATAYMPTFLKSSAPISCEWPSYINWGRRSLAICAAHKIIMIHRRFLGLSFSNSAFSFTRRTCIAASKTILKEALGTTDEHAPVLWIEQAFTTAAGIILTLDAFHRRPAEKEFDEHKRLVMEAIEYLSQFSYSKIATRGKQILLALTRELETSGPISTRKRPREDDATGQTSGPTTRLFDLSSFIKNVSRELSGTTPVASPAVSQTPNTNPDVSWDAFIDMLPPPNGFGGQNIFDDFFLV